MKQRFFLLLVIAITYACSPTDKEIKSSIPKNISKAVIAPELLLQKNGTDLYVGIQYFKDYNDKDQLTLSMNNQVATLLSESPNLSLEGTKALFKFTAIQQTGEAKIKLAIKNDQKTFEQELPFIFIPDFELNTIWNNLSKSYVSLQRTMIDLLKTGGFTLRTINHGENVLSFGTYLQNIDGKGSYLEKRLLDALPGRYELIYSGTTLQEIKITNAEPFIDASFNLTTFYTNLQQKYGNPVSKVQNNGWQVSTYKVNGFDILVYEKPELIYTSIKKS